MATPSNADILVFVSASNCFVNNYFGIIIMAFNGNNKWLFNHCVLVHGPRGSLMNIKLLRNILNCVARRRFVSVTVIWCGSGVATRRQKYYPTHRLAPTCRVTERNTRHAL